ncbi:MAG TPA: TIGR03087 family PEP-CTERM/XrtA system glycosyltransferase [Novosphingobium sp.]|nr:TIGR03087 family PEP-CTERM/XrtA system glycosyltransferase [Novosphingobium sp.]
MTGEILFLAHRVPFPPNRGDKIRSHHVLRHLATLAPVHVACFADDEADLAEAGELAALAASHCLVKRSKPLVLAGIEAVLTGQPVSLTAFHDRRMAAYVRQVLAQRDIAAIYVFSGQMGHYVPADFAGRVICDLVDVDSAKFEAYGRSGKGPMRWVNAREGRLLAAEEARLVGRSSKTLLISAEEAALLRARLSPELACGGAVDVLRNGIDSEYFDPAMVCPEPRLLDFPGPRLIFTGQMDYPPNVAAATRVIERILPAIRKRFPEASFHIVGRSPPESLAERSGGNGVHVWGGVDDMRCWLAGADLALVPLEIARGVQNKVLEAMAMRLAVVLTPGAATGIGAQDAAHFAVGESDAELAERCVALLCDSTWAGDLGHAARRFVVDRLSWPAVLAPLAGLIGFPEPAARHVA